MNKILKPYTIVPSELYVKRDADRQLQNIINDMGRPGYVLVSRQMGKTNLLLNAKREAESPNDIFVYVDLSNPFETAKACFENIIDTILEVNEDILSSVANDIKSSRHNLDNIPPHKQHTTELRKIIKSITGKLVIILDEIDALTKTDYSDRIFSQIRSIYFTRVNFPELERLTYILSGVVEPSEIIKDSKISPFNIGQKIFLNDFIYEEFIEFTKKANLNLEDEILEHIFKWSNGNPRITWDICAEIENLQSNEISKTNIDEIIKNLYLTTYDKPPIDNIRELIKADSELRNAIVEIEYKKGEQISDRVKSKLYLSGIINYTNGSVKVKNEVIRQAINLDWINSLEEDEKGILIIATENYSRGEYAACLSNFEKYLESEVFTSTFSSRYYSYMGKSAYYLGKYDLSLKYLKLTNFDIEDDAYLYYTTQNLKGLNYLNTKKYELSLECFNSVLKRNKKDDIFASAIMNIGYISLQSDNILSISEAKKIFIDVVEEKSIDSTQIEKKQLQAFKTISYFNLAKLYVKESDKENASKAYFKALDISPEINKPRIILEILSNNTDIPNKSLLIEELITLVKLLSPSDLDSMSIFNYSVVELKESLLLLFKEQNNQFYKIAKDSLANCKHENIGSLLYDLGFIAINKKNEYELALSIYNEIYNRKNDINYGITDIDFYSSLRLLAYFKTPSNDFKIVNEYITNFCNQKDKVIDFIDIENFANYIYWFLEKKRYDEALINIEIIKSFKKDVNEEYLINYLVIYNLELNINISISNELKIKETANQILDMANDPKICKYQSNILGKEGLSIIKANAESVLKPKFQKGNPIIIEKKIGRNQYVKVKYKDGTIKELKYKKVEDDLINELCEILN